MNPFEKLLRADGTELVKMLYHFRVDSRRDAEMRREQIAQTLGLNSTQLVCGFGFNKRAAALTDILFVLGFASFGDLAARRNYLFINDIYKQLSINNILEIYASVDTGDALVDSLPDLIFSRLSRIEAEIEGTINPIMIGSYKLEIRAIYERRLAPLEMAETRLTASYSGLRALTNEVALIVENKVMPAGVVFYNPGVNPEEKRRLVAAGLVPRELVETRLNEADLPEPEREVLARALDELGHA